MTKGALPNQNPYAVLGVKDNTPNPYDPSALGIRSNVQGIPSVNPYASLGQRQKNPVQQTLDVIKNNPAVKTVNVKQTDGSTKIYTKDQYVAEQDKLNSGAITQGKTPALSFNKLDFKSVKPLVEQYKLQQDMALLAWLKD